MKTQMKLYIWKDVLCDYTCGVMFAIAASVGQARKLLSKEFILSEDLEKEPEVHDLNTPFAMAVWGGG